MKLISEPSFVRGAIAVGSWMKVSRDVQGLLLPLSVKMQIIIVHN